MLPIRYLPWSHQDQGYLTEVAMTTKLVRFARPYTLEEAIAECQRQNASRPLRQGSAFPRVSLLPLPPTDTAGEEEKT